MMEIEEIKAVLRDWETIRNILEESSPHNEDVHTRPVGCKCGYCFMETLAIRSQIKLEAVLNRMESAYDPKFLIRLISYLKCWRKK